MSKEAFPSTLPTQESRTPIKEQKIVEANGEKEQFLKLLRRSIRMLMTAGMVYTGFQAADYTVSKIREYTRATTEPRVADQSPDMKPKAAKRNKNKKKNNVQESLPADLQLTPLNFKEGTLSVSELKNILNRTYPKDWFDNIASIGPGENPAPGVVSYLAYGKESKATAFIETAGSGKHRIFFTKLGQEGYMQMGVNDVLSHESCHGHDWERDERLSGQERSELFSKIRERLSSHDRYRSSYVEGIPDSVVLPRSREYIKMGEYWAEICSEYMNSGKNLNVKDYRLVDEVVRKYDPHFNPGNAFERRRKTVLKLIDPYYETHDYNGKPKSSVQN